MVRFAIALLLVLLAIASASAQTPVRVMTGYAATSGPHAVLYPTVGGVRFVLDQVAIREPKANNFAPETFMDLRFVKQLDDSGFIKGLYPKG